jgi:hypothetical protein
MESKKLTGIAVARLEQFMQWLTPQPRHLLCHQVYIIGDTETSMPDGLGSHVGCIGFKQ